MPCIVPWRSGHCGMFLVDTNLLVYARNERAPENVAARQFLENCRTQGESWLATWSIFYEFLRVVTHPRIFTNPLSLGEGWDFLHALMVSPSFGLIQETERHGDIIRDLGRRYPGVRGNHVHDFHIAALMFEHGVREIRTADDGFHRFRFLNVVNPLLDA